MVRCGSEGDSGTDTKTLEDNSVWDLPGYAELGFVQEAMSMPQHIRHYPEMNSLTVCEQLSARGGVPGEDWRVQGREGGTVLWMVTRA